MIPHLYKMCKQISGTQAGWAKNQCGRDEEIFADGSLGRGPCHRGTGGFGSQREESYLLFDQVSSDDLPRPRSASFNINRNKRRTYSHVSAFRFLAFSFLTCLTNSQTWNLSKNLHRWIFRLKILRHQFYLISTVLVRKKHKK